MEHLIDSDLVELAQNGNSQAFDTLAERYRLKITRLAFRYVNDADTALDLVQDIFFKVFRNLSHFRGDAKFSSWLFRLAVNDCIDHIRRLKTRKEHSLSAIQERGFDVADPRHSAKTTLEKADSQSRAKAALDRLPSSQRTVVVMKIFEEMTFEQIAEILEQPQSTVKSRLYKALNSLATMIRQQNVIERGKL